MVCHLDGLVGDQRPNEVDEHVLLDDAVANAPAVGSHDLVEMLALGECLAINPHVGEDAFDLGLCTRAENEVLCIVLHNPVVTFSFHDIPFQFSNMDDLRRDVPDRRS